MRHKYNSIKERASERGLSFDLTFDFFKELKNSDCIYCGVEKEYIQYYCEVMGINTPFLSIDRKDNSKGYSNSNCVPSCYLCNKIKGSFFNYEEMLKIGKNFVRPKLLANKEKAMESYQEWLDENTFVNNKNFEDWDLTESFKLLKGD